MTSEIPPRQTLDAIRGAKHRSSSPPLVMVTAYDVPTARIADAAGVDMILVGDSVGMVVLGYEDTLNVTIEDMERHVGMVSRARPDPFVVADMPWMSYHLSREDTLRNAARLVRAGAQAIKMEGGRKRTAMVRAVVDAEIPVMGHLGLTPQSHRSMGGYRVQATDEAAAAGLVEEAHDLVDAGCFALVVEGVPADVGRAVTESVDVPVIGIGAGPSTDGQVLVFHDVVGLENRYQPKFVRRYADAFGHQVSAIQAFASDVRTGAFPTQAEAYGARPSVQEPIADPSERSSTDPSERG